MVLLSTHNKINVKTVRIENIFTILRSKKKKKFYGPMSMCPIPLKKSAHYSLGDFLPTGNKCIIFQ